MEALSTLKTDKKDSKNRIVNVYVSGDVFQTLTYFRKQSRISLSKYIVILIKSKLEASNVNNGGLSVIDASRFNDRFDVYSLRLDDRKKLGVSVDDELYSQLKEFSNRNGTTMSEVIRVFINEHIASHEDIVSKYNAEISSKALNERQFEMYIDLG